MVFNENYTNVSEPPLMILNMALRFTIQWIMSTVLIRNEACYEIKDSEVSRELTLNFPLSTEGKTNL